MQLNLGSRNETLHETFKTSSTFVQFFLVACKLTTWQMCKHHNLGSSLTVIPGDTDMKSHILVSYIQNIVYESTIINMATTKVSEFTTNKSNVDRMCTKEISPYTQQKQEQQQQQQR
jgi:hypothetical protein